MFFVGAGLLAMAFNENPCLPGKLGDCGTIAGKPAPTEDGAELSCLDQYKKCDA
jgi:hypothetical protein